jgi:hypothetical protein
MQIHNPNGYTLWDRDRAIEIRLAVLHTRTKGGGKPNNKSGSQKHCLCCRFSDREELRIEKHVRRSAVSDGDQVPVAVCKMKKMDRLDLQYAEESSRGGKFLS